MRKGREQEFGVPRKKRQQRDRAEANRGIVGRTEEETIKEKNYS